MKQDLDIEILENYYKRLKNDKKLELLRNKQGEFLSMLSDEQRRHFEDYFTFVLLDVHFRNIDLIKYVIRYLKKLERK